jgi:hypothetical protein
MKKDQAMGKHKRAAGRLVSEADMQKVDPDESSEAAPLRILRNPIQMRPSGQLPLKATATPASSSDKLSYRCPLCHGELRRTWRQPVDRFASLFLPLHRYRCVNFGCQWEGNFRTHSHHAQAANSASAALTEPTPVAAALPVFVTTASATVAVLAGLLIASQWTDVSAWVGTSALADVPATAAAAMPTVMGHEIPVGPRHGKTVIPIKP